MHQRLLHILALAFIALVIAQSLLGGLLFWRIIGLSADQILAHYHGKSLHGLLEVMLPHTLFIGIALMATLHFLAFVQTISEIAKKRITHLLFTLFLFDQGSPICLIQGIEAFAYVKIAAFAGFEFILGLIWIVIFQYTLKELHD